MLFISPDRSACRRPWVASIAYLALPLSQSSYLLCHPSIVHSALFGKDRLNDTYPNLSLNLRVSRCGSRSSSTSCPSLVNILMGWPGERSPHSFVLWTNVLQDPRIHKSLSNVTVQSKAAARRAYFFFTKFCTPYKVRVEEISITIRFLRNSWIFNVSFHP